MSWKDELNAVDRGTKDVLDRYASLPDMLDGQMDIAEEVCKEFVAALGWSRYKRSSLESTMSVTAQKTLSNCVTGGGCGISVVFPKKKVLAEDIRKNGRPKYRGTVSVWNYGFVSKSEASIPLEEFSEERLKAVLKRILADCTVEKW